MGSFKKVLFKYCIHPGRCGILGFIIFLSVIGVTKFLGTIFSSSTDFSIDIEDMLLSLIGFCMFFLIKILGYFEEKKPEEDLTRL